MTVLLELINCGPPDGVDGFPKIAYNAANTSAAAIAVKLVTATNGAAASELIETSRYRHSFTILQPWPRERRLFLPDAQQYSIQISVPPLLLSRFTAAFPQANDLFPPSCRSNSCRYSFSRANSPSSDQLSQLSSRFA